MPKLNREGQAAILTPYQSSKIRDTLKGPYKKSTNPGTSYKRTSDQLVSVQLIATVATVLAAFLGFQWQLGNLVSGISVQLTKSDLQVQELKSDVAELKATVRELSQQLQMDKPRSQYNMAAPSNGSF
jgi:hypothetical protein